MLNKKLAQPETVPAEILRIFGDLAIWQFGNFGMLDSFTIREESLNKCINSTKMTQIEHEQWDIETNTLIPVNLPY